MEVKTKAIEKLIPLFEDKRKHLSKHGFFYTEKHLQCLWFDSAIRPAVLLTCDGEEVFVEDPGEWNKEAGPDFLNATLRVGKEKRLLYGDVEIHISPEDWIKHNHFADEKYNKVIAHITYFPGSLSKTVLPETVLQISLQKAVERLPYFSFDVIDLFSIPELPRAKNPPCQQILKKLSIKEIKTILNEAGKIRVAIKAEKIKSAIGEGGVEQVFYEEIMAALGYKNNSYYKDIFDYVSTRTAQITSARFATQRFITYVNTDYARSRGIELEFKKRIGK